MGLLLGRKLENNSQMTLLVARLGRELEKVQGDMKMEYYFGKWRDGGGKKLGSTLCNKRFSREFRLFRRQSVRNFGPFYSSTGSKPWGFGVLRAKKASFTVSRDGISRHASGPEIDPKFRARRDSVSADREPGRFCPGGAETPWFQSRAT